MEAQIAGLPHDDTVYVTLGTVVNKLPGVFETVLAALDGVGVNAIVTVGPDVDPARLGPQPAHVLVERYIPQSLVLARCRAIVAHGGAGTMLGALAHGVPQVLLPHGAEQHLNAEACRRQGAALVSSGRTRGRRHPRRAQARARRARVRTGGASAARRDRRHAVGGRRH